MSRRCQVTGTGPRYGSSISHAHNKTKRRFLPNLQKKKILIVHQFGDANVKDGVPFMIENKKTLRTFEHVDLVIDADGLGEQSIKVVKYNKMTDAEVYPFIKFRGIKIFFPNPWEKYEHFDKPPMNVDQILGRERVIGGPKMHAQPNVIIIA